MSVGVVCRLECGVVWVSEEVHTVPYATMTFTLNARDQA